MQFLYDDVNTLSEARLSFRAVLALSKAIFKLTTYCDPWELFTKVTTAGRENLEQNV